MQVLKVPSLLLMSSSKRAQGYNVATGEYVDLVAEGIVDPAMVTRTALQNAVRGGSVTHN